MRYAGKNLEEHEATFLRRVASVPGMTEGEKVDLWINSFGNLPEMRAQIDRAGPETWKHAAEIARREDRLRRTAQQSYGVPASEGSEAAYGRTATSARGTGSASHLNTLDAGEGSNSSVATPAAAQQPPEFWMEALAAMAVQLQC